MTVDVTAPPPSASPAAEEVYALALEHQQEQAVIRAAIVAAILGAWAGMDAKKLVQSWTTGVGHRIFLTLSNGQETVASAAGRYIEAALRVQGVTVDVPTIDSLKFAGIASDGRDLDDLLVGAVIRSFEGLKRGDSPQVALSKGADFLTLVASTQISDAGRAADQVALVAAEPREADVMPSPIVLDTTSPGRGAPVYDIEKILREHEEKKNRKKVVHYGWVRLLTPPSCSRCAVLAGRFYKWNDGFYRHPMCDCRHIPATENVAGDLVTDPKLYFESLTKEEQDLYFGVANSRAIRSGADINRVVNATTRKGALYTADDGRRYTAERAPRGGEVLRPTPWQIYRDARGSREEAVRLLREFGYIL